MAKLVEGHTNEQARKGHTFKVSRLKMGEKGYAGEVGLAKKTGRGKK